MSPADQPDSPEPDGTPARHPLDWVERNGAEKLFLEELRRRQRRRSRWQIASAAAGMGGIAGLLLLALVPDKGITDIGGIHAPASAEAPVVVWAPERRSLPDGTVVELHEGAELAVEFSEQVRGVSLKKGKAHFQVARNDSIPFIVSVDGFQIRAVGTAFSVHALDAQVEVLVTEGRVALGKGELADRRLPFAQPAADNVRENFANGGVAEALATVDAGNRAVLVAAMLGSGLATPQITPVTALEINRSLAWRVPRIEFSGTPLADAVSIINRYSPIRLVIADAELERLQLNGFIRADNVEALVQLLQKGYQVTVEHRQEEIVLRRAPISMNLN